MKYDKPFLRIFLGSIVALPLLCFCPVYGSAFEYSWSGQIVSTNDDDPWGIGTLGQSFELAMRVSPDSYDLHDISREFAAFEVDDARLLIAGQEFAYSGNGTIDFTDRLAGSIDLVSFSGFFEQFGHQIEFGSTAVLPSITLAFFDNAELPPNFPPTATSMRAAYGPGPYTSIVPEDVVVSVTVAPEPALSSLWMLLSLLIAIIRYPRQSLPQMLATEMGT